MSRRRTQRSRSRSRRRYEVRLLLSLSFLSSIIIEIDLCHRTTNITSFLMFIIIIVSSLVKVQFSFRQSTKFSFSFDSSSINNGLDIKVGFADLLYIYIIIYIVLKIIYEVSNDV
jgi:hypothetical protein